jgi:hypothetical protein
LVVYPDGRQVAVQDRVTAQIWSKIYADLTPDRGTLPLIPSTQQKRQLAQARRRWLEENPDELWINPDARTYAATFVSPEEDSTYHLLTGPVSEMGERDWRAASAQRIEIVDAALHGRFETSIVHLQGFCLRLYPALEHITATRHIVPAHRVLIWEQESSSHACVMQNYLEAWLHLEVTQDNLGRVSIAVLEDTPLRADAGRQRIEALEQTLAAEDILVSDSYSPS